MKTPTHVNEVAQLQVTRQASSLARDTLHETAVASEDVGVVVDQIKAVLVVHGGHVRLGDTETDRVREALAERASGDLDTIGVSGLGVTRSERIKLTEVLEVVKRQLEAKEVEVDVLQSASAKRFERRSGIAIFQYLRMSGGIVSSASNAWIGRTHPLESTNRSRLYHLEFLGLVLKNLGAM